MKKLFILFLTVCLLTSVIPVSVNAAIYEISGDSLIFKPPVGTEAYVKYKLIDGPSEVTGDISWSVDGEGVSIDSDGYMKVTNDAEGEILVSASAEYGYAEMTVTVSEKFLFYDYEDGTTGERYAGEYGHGGVVSASESSIPSIQEESNGNKYLKGHGTVVVNESAGNDPRLIYAFRNEPNKEIGVTEMHEAAPKVITLEGKFFNHNTGAWGSSGKQWLFFLVFNNADGSFLNGAQLGHGTQGPTLRVIDIHTDQANACFELSNYHGAYSDFIGYDNVLSGNGAINVTNVGALNNTSLWGWRNWVNARMTIDFEKGVYTVWADDRIVYENYPLPTYGKTASVSLRNWFYSCAGDDIAIYSGTKNPKRDEALPESTPEEEWTKAYGEENEKTESSYCGKYNFELYKDEVNKTSLVSELIDGKYAVDVEFTVENPDPYAELIFSGDANEEEVVNPFAKFRVSPNGAMTVVHDESYNTIPGYKPAEKNMFRLIVDTEAESFDVYLNDFENVAWSGENFFGENDGFFGALSGVATVGNVKVHSVNVYNVENGTVYEAGMPVFESMPESLVTDPENVTENIDVTPLSEYNITSGDESVLEKDGTIHWSPFDASLASLYASFTENELNFKKGYSFVIAPSLEGYDIFELCYDEYKYLDVIPPVADRDLKLNTNTILGIDAEWHSSDTDVIGHDGKLKKGKDVGFADMTLALSKDGERKTYGPVSVAVAPDGTANVEISEYETSMALSGYPLLNAFDTDNSTYFKGTKRNNRENSVTVEIDESIFVSRLFVAEKTPSIVSYKLECSEDKEEWTELRSGSVTDIKSKVIAFEPVKTKYLKITFPELSESFVEISELVPMCILTERQAADSALDEIVINPKVKVKDDMKLLLEGRYGSKIKWSSSPEGIISETGKFTAPEYDTEVTLTASVEVDGSIVERKFFVTASGRKGPKGASIISGGGGGGGSGSSDKKGFSPAYPTEEVKPSVVPEKTEGVFSDMEKHWAKDFVKKLSEKGIVSAAKEYFPERFITREEFTKLLICAKGIQIEKNLSNPFSDAKSGAWYLDYILSAQKAGIISGISEDAFGIGMNITRQDAALMLIRALGDIGTEAEETTFTDDDSIAAYSREAVYKAKSIGLVSGYEDNSFKPAGLLTRGEAAAIICRFINAEN